MSARTRSPRCRTILRAWWRERSARAPRLQRQSVVDARSRHPPRRGGLDGGAPAAPRPRHRVRRPPGDQMAGRVYQVVVVGLSMGGTLACWLAERHPEVAGLVAINPFVQPSEDYRNVITSLLEAG